MSVDPQIKNRYAVVVATEGWNAAETWLHQQHPDAELATYRDTVRAELADEHRASLVVAIAGVASPILVIACYYLFAKGVQPIAGKLAILMVLVLVGIIALGIFGAASDHLRSKALTR